MKILSIILGVLLAICGVSCMFKPIMSFIDTGYLLVILLLVYGIIGIIRVLTVKMYKMDFIFSILSVIASLVILFVPRMLLMTEGLLVYIMAAWFIVKGIDSVYISVKTKSKDNKWWIWGLVIGILSGLLGIYSFLHPLLVAFTMGTLIGLYFIETGIDMVIMAVQNKPSEG